jgi:hypothetical protein
MGLSSNIWANANTAVPSVPAVVGAENGLSLNGDKVVLGSDMGTDDGQLLSNRQISLNNYSLKFFSSFGAGMEQSLTVNNIGQLEYNSVMNLPGDYYVAVATSRAANINAFGTALIGYDIGFDNSNRSRWAVSSAASGAQGFRSGTNLTASGAVPGNFYIHGEVSLQLMAGGSVPSLSTSNVVLDSTTTRLNKTVLIGTLPAAAAVANAVLVRRTDTLAVEGVTGATGSFTSNDGKTITVVSGVITSIV